MEGKRERKNKVELKDQNGKNKISVVSAAVRAGRAHPDSWKTSSPAYNITSQHQVNNTSDQQFSRATLKAGTCFSPAYVPQNCHCRVIAGNRDTKHKVCK